jgi:hypothetical protein
VDNPQLISSSSKVISIMYMMSNCIIYIIRGPSANGEKIYIGQTNNTLKIRWNKHLTDARHFVNGRKKNGTCSALYSAMKKYGIDQYKISVLLECKSDDLDFYEKAMITTYNSVAPNGFNLKTGGNSNGKHCSETKKLISERTIEAMELHLNSYRNHSESIGLPKYVNFLPNYKKNRVAFNVYHSKLGKRKVFSVIKGYPIDKIRAKAITYIEIFNKEYEEKIDVQRLNGSGSS